MTKRPPRLTEKNPRRFTAKVRRTPSQTTSVVLAAALLITMSGPAWAADIVVNSLADAEVAGNGECTLREAMNNANGDTDTTGGDCAPGTGADNITVSAVFAGSPFITLGSTLPAVTDVAGLTIEKAFITGNNAVQVFRVMGAGPTPAEWARLTLHQVFVLNGRASDSGGAIFIDRGAVTLSSTQLVGNSAIGNGAGIYGAFCTLTLVNSTLRVNVGSGDGGGIGATDCTITLTNSTLSNNFAQRGGGLSIASNSIVTLTNSTLSGNSAGLGGGLYLAAPEANTSSTATLINSTVSANGGTSVFSDLDPFGGFQNSLVARRNIFAHGVSGQNCGGFVTASGVNNLVTDDSCPVGGVFTQVTDAQLNLGPLTDNGGGNATHALLPGSVAIDAGDQAECTADQVTQDQRGFPRDTNCDIGAYEFGAAGLADLGITISKVPNSPKDNRNLTYTVTVENHGSDPASGVLFWTPIPVNATLVSVTPSGPFPCVPFAGNESEVLVCFVGNIDNGQSAAMTIVVKAIENGNPTFNTTATVDSYADDLVPANNTASLQTKLHGGK